MWCFDIESGIAPGEIVIVMASEQTKFTMSTIDKPRSKWPYWVYFDLDNNSVYTYEKWRHWLHRQKLKTENIEVVIEKRWDKKINPVFPYKTKRQQGILYKFLTAEDRLIFLMSIEQ